MDVDPSRVLPRASGWSGSQRRALEEGHLDVVGEDVEPQEPALALDAIEGRVPSHGLAHVRYVAHDERVEAAPDVAFPAGHGRDVGLHGGVAIGLRDLRVAACEESWLRRDPLGDGPLWKPGRLLELPAGHCVQSN